MIVPPRAGLAVLPTPFEPLPRLTAALAGPRLWIKRDDLTGLALGGNKTRKLDLLVADAEARGARTLITTGAVQSNHCRQTAAAAARRGLACRLVLAGDRPAWASGNLMLDLLCGAQPTWCARAERDAVLARVADEAERAGERPYVVPYGGSNPLGAAAYGLAWRELDDQCRAAGVTPAAVVFASSSGGTQAGLVAGAHATGFRGRILGISVDESHDVLAARVAALAPLAAAVLGETIEVAPGEVDVLDEWAAPGYGVAGEPEREAILAFARHEGVLLDPVYTGRAAAGLLALVRRGAWARSEDVVFWHTGGTPALFAAQHAKLLTTDQDV